MPVPGVVPIVQDEDEEETGLVEVWNDLEATVEVNFSSGWRIIYPRKVLQIERNLEIVVRLRDAPDISGICRVGVANSALLTSKNFGDFGRQAEEFVESEQLDANNQKRLREAATTEAAITYERQRQEALRQRTWFFLRYGCNLCIVLCMWAVILVVFIMAPLENYAIAIAVVLGIGASGCCMSSSLRWSLYLMGKRIAAWRSVDSAVFHVGSSSIFIPLDFAS